MIARVLYCAGVLLRNRSIFENLDFLKKSQHWDIPTLQEHQFHKLKGLVKHAYDNSAYYREKYVKCNFSPDMLSSFSDLSKIPVITKQEVLSNTQAIQAANITEKLFYSETGGSTGRALVFYRNKSWDAWHRASIYRGYAWYGVMPWDRNGYLRGYNFSFKKQIKTRFLDMLQNRFRLFSYKSREIDRFVKQLRTATFIGGYSSMVYEVAKRININFGVKPIFHLKMVKGTSETILDKYQEEIVRAFGQKMISEYGAAEAGIIAFECPKGNMHINMETVIVEEENNEILVTNLVSDSFPIIRYRLGDYIKIDTGTRCGCGMQHHILKEVMGRVGKVIYGNREEYPSLSLYFVFKNLVMTHNIIINYQGIQRTKGLLELNIEGELSAKEKSLLETELFKYFKDDLSVTLREGGDLKSGNKKKHDFVSEI